jgi:hypothetical protein
MHAPRLPRLLLFAAAVSLAATLGAAESKPDEPTFGLPTPSDLKPEQQEWILQALKTAEPRLRMFAVNFQSARFSMVRTEPKSSTVIIATTVDVGRFGVSLVFTGIFDPEFTKLRTSRCDLFGAYDNERELKPRQRRKPLLLKLEDMEQFCRDPEGFLQKQFAAENAP